MKNRQQWLTVWVSDEIADGVQAVADQLGVSKHKVTTDAIRLGLNLAKYKIALERVMEEKLKFRGL